MEKTKNTLSPGKLTYFTHPFSREYWAEAARVFRQPKMLVLAAVIVALRVVVKSLRVPVADNLYVTFGFFFNAAGSMVYGPLMGLLGGAVSDTLGAIIFPSGAYFFPYIFSEMLGSLIFALFLWRVKFSAWRVILSRFAVTVLVNLVCDPIISIWYYKLVLGKSYAFFTVQRLVKNVVLFPVQALLLTLFLSALIPALRRTGYISADQPKVLLEKKHYIVIAIMTAVAAGLLLFYIFAWPDINAALKAA